MKFAKAYNFLYSWQLIPEKCDYQHGAPPKSSIYKMEGNEDDSITISLSWLTHDNQSFKTAYKLVPDGELHPFEHPEVAASIRGEFSGSHTFTVTATNGEELVWQVVKEIQPNGYMKLTQTGTDADGNTWTNTQYYHKQLSVLPYASSVSGAVIKPTEEGMIKHKALTAMEEQTNMQLDQIRKQIELLAVQAHAIQKRRELSLMIYEASLKFKPNIGQVYHLYEKQDGSCILSLVSPDEWGGAGPFKEFVSSVKLLADHTWVEI